MTVRALELVQRADVLVYDRLVSPDVVAQAPATCELVYVGKSPDRHTLAQHEINALLVEGRAGTHARAPQRRRPVRVRPRGGGEAEGYDPRHPVRRGVPGVVTASPRRRMGIPVTHRGMASSFTVITGHEDPSKLASSVDWSRWARLKAPSCSSWA